MPVLAQGVQDVATLTEVAIVGDGSRSLAIAGALALHGHPVRVWALEQEVPAECEIRYRRARVGHLRGQVGYAEVSSDPAAVISGVSVLILSSETRDYPHMLQRIAAHLANGQTLILVNAPLGAALELSTLLAGLRADLQVNILEMGSLFDSVKIEGKVALINGPRACVSICGISRNQTRRGLALASGLWGGLVPASNVLERGFTEAERLLRPLLRLFRLIGFKASDTGSWEQVVTPALVSIVSGIGGELKNVAKAYGCVIPGLSQILKDYVRADGDSLAESLLTIAQILIQEERFRPHTAGQLVEQLRCEAAETLVLVESLARLARVPVPLVDSMIELSSFVVEQDLRREGRGLADLGLVGCDVSEVVELVNA